MVSESDRWDAAMVGQFFVHKDGTPHGFTTIPANDPDLQVFKDVESAQRAVDRAQENARRVGDQLAWSRNADQIHDGVVQVMRATLNAADGLRSAFAAEDRALTEWAKVVKRLGFKDSFGEEHPLPERLAKLLPDEEEAS